MLAHFTCQSFRQRLNLEWIAVDLFPGSREETKKRCPIRAREENLCMFRIPKILVLPLLLPLTAGASYAVTDAISHSSKPAIAAQGGPPPPEELERFDARVQQQLAEEKLKPRFSGQLDDFQVTTVEDAASPDHFCVDGVRESAEGNRSFAPSELNQPNMTEQVACSNGTVAATYSLEHGRRSYFREAPTIYANAPIDRLEVVEIEGRRALVVNPPTDYAPYFIFIIARASTESEPGILVSLMGGPDRSQTLDLAAAALAAALSE